MLTGVLLLLREIADAIHELTRLLEQRETRRRIARQDRAPRVD